MDMSMILGLALAGSIMLLNGNKRQVKEQKPQPNDASEFIVSVGANGGLSINPKQTKKS
ncbi:MAG: hypothetical protein KTR27_06720 [Leptolyngbyaceae cyanobacterium MAG.088]|nr:hypothetical protein [Leptolyngbyaceae cyanobacterium MAG.088]